MEQETMHWEFNAVPWIYTLPALLVAAPVVAIIVGVFFAVVPQPKK